MEQEEWEKAKKDYLANYNKPVLIDFLLFGLVFSIWLSILFWDGTSFGSAALTATIVSLIFVGVSNTIGYFLIKFGLKKWD